MGIQCMLRMTFFEKHQQQLQHSAEVPGGKLRDRIQALDPTTKKSNKFILYQAFLKEENILISRDCFTTNLNTFCECFYCTFMRKKTNLEM